MEYQEFLALKTPRAVPAGFGVSDKAINARLFPFQRAAVLWALERGRAALFEACGLGKTGQQLEWARHVHERTGGDVLVLAPLAVAQQTRREGEKFGIPVTVCRSQVDVRTGINVTNYEMVEHFDAARFAGVVLDEASVLKNYSGSLRKRLTETFAQTRYRLCCTATPAPNDHMEIGQQAEFLGIMPANEMLSRWFINDSMSFGTYRLKGHAAGAFWEWVASWALSAQRPSDLGGYADDGYILPPLRWHEQVVTVDRTTETGGLLFRVPDLNATGLHQEMRRTAPARAAVAAQLVRDTPGPWLVWCNTNYEADELVRLLPEAVEVRGSESVEAKERKLEAFVAGRARVLISKPSLCGHGLNLQHCHQVVFVGLSYSFEQLYQAVRRCWRYGQEQPVDSYVVIAETEESVLATVHRKMAAHEEMLDSMAAATAKLLRAEHLTLSAYRPSVAMSVPSWLRSVA